LLTEELLPGNRSQMNLLWCKNGDRALFLPFYVKAIGTTGITYFQTITARLYESLLGSYDLSRAVINKGLGIARER